jgi:hypothetical protein
MRMHNRFSYHSSTSTRATGVPLGVRMRTLGVEQYPFDRKWRYETSPRSDLRSPDPFGVPLGGVRACATWSCAISALVGPFHRKWRHQTSSIGFPLEVTWSEVPLWCSLGRPRPISSMAPGTSPYHYLPLSFHFISAFNNYISYKGLLFSDMLCSTPRISAFSLWGVLNNLIVKWMKWYIWKFPSTKCVFNLYFYTFNV